MRYYVHGAGRAGAAAWSAQADEPGASFCQHDRAQSAAEKAKLVADQAPHQRHSLIAHSLGAVAAALAMRDHNLQPESLVLVEPALYDVARGNEAVEAHIAPMTKAHAAATNGDLFAFWQIAKPVFFGSPATDEDWESDRAAATYFATLDRPWGHGIEATFVTRVPTLVVTGGWNEEYEAIAAALVAAGAEHTLLQGSQHRPQDHADFNETVRQFCERVRR